MVFGAFLCPGENFFTSGYIVGPHRHSGRSSNQLSRQSRLHYPSPFFTPATTSALSLSRNTDTGEGSGNIFETLFTGGYGASEEDIAAAARIATKIRSASDLPGWEKAPMRRKGSTRPRHRAWGGDSELPVQEKPNYDPALEACPEKWLTQEELEAKFRLTGTQSDILFVSLAGPNKYAERDVCEEKISNWRKSGKFDQSIFVEYVKKGQNDLILGYSTFVGLNLFFVLNIVFPTNPVGNLLVYIVGGLQDMI